MRRSLPLVAADVGFVAIAYYLAFVLRFTDEMPGRYHRLFITTGPWVVFGTVVVLASFGLYKARPRRVGLHDVDRLILALAIAVILVVAIIAIVRPVDYAEYVSFGAGRAYVRSLAVGMPAGVAATYLALCVVLLAGVRRATGAIDQLHSGGADTTRRARNGPALP